MSLATATPRKSIPHFHQMSDAEFSNLLLHPLPHRKVSVFLKVDGVGFRFGRDSDGVPFVEGSRTGPIYNSSEFIKYDEQRPADKRNPDRAQGYYSLSTRILRSNFIKKLPYNTKILAEVLHRGIAKSINFGQYTFVRVPYCPRSVGADIVVVPYGVTAANGCPSNELVLIGNLAWEAQIDSIRFFNSELKSVYFDTDSIARSLAAVDRSQSNSNVIISQIKQNLADNILEAYRPQMGRLGPIDEGIIVYFNGTKYKITTPEYKSL